jgi:hypothetical protein
MNSSCGGLSSVEEFPKPINWRGHRAMITRAKRMQSVQVPADGPLPNCEAAAAVRIGKHDDQARYHPIVFLAVAMRQEEPLYSSSSSSEYCGGDLPTRLMTRGYVTVGIACSTRSTWT